MEVYKWNDNLAIKMEYSPVTVEVVKSLSKRRFEKAHNHWVFPPVLAVMNQVKGYFPQAVWTSPAQEIYDDKKAEEAYRQRVAAGLVDTSDDLSSVPMRRSPFDHQRKAIVLGRNQRVFAYLMEQGTGKTKVLLDDAAHNYRLGRIDAILIIAPNSVKTNWVNVDGEDEVSKDLAPDIPHIKAAWFADMRGDRLKAWNNLMGAVKYKERCLKILAVNVEGLKPDSRVMDALIDFVCSTKCMIVVDESTRIKRHTAKRSRAAKLLRKNCQYARIMSGTPIVKSPLHAFSQFEFLDPNIIGIPTYTEFQSRYAVMGGFGGKQVFRYVNVDDLTNKLAGCSFRVTKDQCLDLPPKVHVKRLVYMTKDQEGHYKRLRDQLITQFEANIGNRQMLSTIEVTNVLSAMVRLQQVVAGYLPIINEETGEQIGVQKIACPKIEEAMDIIDECDNKVIVWCRFKFEVKEMSDALTKEGIEHVVFDGSTSEQDRVDARMDFNNDQSTKVFVGQIQTGGIGLTLNAGSTVIYLSNTFSTEDRVQSEDRCHRIGQTKSVEYIDLISPGTIDERVIKVLRENKRLSDEILKDGFKKWI